MARKTIPQLQQMARDGEKAAYITGYDYLTAKYEERAGIDIILVGDSLGMVQLGYSSTFPVTMEDCIGRCKAVRRGAPNTFIIGDMPFMSYQVSNEQAIENAGRFVKEADMDCVKLEGGDEASIERVRAIVGSGVMVMGHIGLTPQFAAQMGGFKAQGKSFEAVEKLIEQAKALEEAGAWSMLLEGVPAITGKAVTKAVNIPVYGIGAGSYTDGQAAVYADQVGFYDDFTPKFAKRYAEIGKIMQEAFAEYVKEVKDGQFPDDAVHSYKIDPDVEAKVQELIDKM